MRGRLLDTNIVIALLRKQPWVEESIEESDDIFLPSIVVGELTFGALKSTHVDANLAVIRKFIKESVVLSCDTETSGHYGRLKFELEKKGKPIPDNDIWIAAVAVQYDLELITRDRHFEVIRDLKLRLLRSPARS